MKQFIISIGRQLGSGGSDIGKLVADKMGVKLYDKNILEAIAAEKQSDPEELRKFDEKPSNPLFSRRVREYSNSTEDILAEMQFEYLKRIADSGESFVLVGRCGDSIFKDKPGLATIFVHADDDFRVERVMKYFDIGSGEAKLKMAKVDRQRKAYHNNYADTDWGEMESYDLCIDSSVLGIEGTADFIESFVSLKNQL